MRDTRYQFQNLWRAIGLALFLVGCNATPTVPIPPPEMTDVTPPGEDGQVQASGPAGTAGDGDVVLVFNDDQGKGVMIEAEEDGSFQVYLEAKEGEELIIQVKRDNVLSREESRLVPSAE